MIDQKLVQLVEKLKGKSVYDNLKAISQGKCKDRVQETIGISSLCTHALIEMQKDKSFRELVTILYEKFGELLYHLDDK